MYRRGPVRTVTPHMSAVTRKPYPLGLQAILYKEALRRGFASTLWVSAKQMVTQTTDDGTPLVLKTSEVDGVSVPLPEGKKATSILYNIEQLCTSSATALTSKVPSAVRSHCSAYTGKPYPLTTTQRALEKVARQRHFATPLWLTQSRMDWFDPPIRVLPGERGTEVVVDAKGHGECLLLYNAEQTTGYARLCARYDLMLSFLNH